MTRCSLAWDYDEKDLAELEYEAGLWLDCHQP